MYREKKAINIALYGLLIALAMVLSFVETLIPIPIPVPGVKLGLANLVTVVGLYLIGIPGTIAVTLIRIVLVGLSFGNPYSMIYGLSGSFLSLFVMAILKKTGKLPDRYQRPRRYRPQHRPDHIRSCHCPDSRRILLSPVPPRRRLHRRNPDRSCRRDHYRTPDARNARYKKIKYRLY